MVELHQLEGLVAFAEFGTLSKAAENLSITQPALTKSMQNLEAELRVQLFKREPNKIRLTETGEYAAKEAKQVLLINHSFDLKVKNFDQNHTQITAAADAPDPLIVLRAINNSNIKINYHFLSRDYLKLLKEQQYVILLLNHPLDDPQINSVYLGTENLAVNFPQSSPFAREKEISFKDLSGTSFLVAQNVGFWGELFKKEIPNAKFLYQDDKKEYSQLLNFSIMPYFTTNLTQIDDLWGKGLPQDRVMVPVSDPIAHQKFYACFLKKNSSRVTDIIQQLQDKWEKFDS